MGKGQSISFGSSKPSENTSSFFGVYPVRGSEYKPNINAQMGNRRKSHYILSQPGFDNYYGWKIQWNPISYYIDYIISLCRCNVYY